MINNKYSRYEAEILDLLKVLSVYLQESSAPPHLTQAISRTRGALEQMALEYKEVLIENSETAHTLRGIRYSINELLGPEDEDL